MTRFENVGVFIREKVWLAPNLFPYKYSNILRPSHSSYLPAYEDGTECSETSEYNIQTPEYYPEESTQHSEHGESLKSRILYTVSIYCILLVCFVYFGFGISNFQHVYHFSSPLSSSLSISSSRPNYCSVNYFLRVSTFCVDVSLRFTFKQLHCSHANASAALPQQRSMQEAEWGCGMLDVNKV